MQRVVAIGLVLCIAGSSAMLKAEDGFIGFQAYYPLQRSMLSYRAPEAFSKAVANSREWTALWREIGSSSAVEGEESGQTREAPEIDFENYTLLVVASGARPSGGYSVAVQSVWESESHVEVVALELRPLGRDCTAIAVVTYPVAFALIPRTSKPVQFKIQHADLRCGQ
jgi:PrcB C-terminal